MNDTQECAKLSTPWSRHKDLVTKRLSNGLDESTKGLTKLLARSLSHFLGRTEDAIQ